MSETIGIVGIGVMGRNIALNFSDNDINVVVLTSPKIRSIILFMRVLKKIYLDLLASMIL